MGIDHPYRPRYNVMLIATDMAAKGWNGSDLARVSGLPQSVISRFLRGEVQTAKTAAKIARAFGYQTTRRYLVEPEGAVA